MSAQPIEPALPGPGALASARAVAAARRGLAAGRAVVLVHHASGSGHFIASAKHVDVETLELISAHSRGVLVAAMTAERMRRLGLGGPPVDGRRFAAPVDLVGRDRAGSLEDRVATLRALASDETTPADLAVPGHVVPAEAHPDGCLGGLQLPDAAYDLARLAGAEVGLYADLAEPARIAGDSAARERVGRELGLTVLTIRDLVVHRERQSRATRRVVSAGLPTAHGDLVAIGYRSNRADDDYVAFVCGEPSRPALPVYVHSRCSVSDVFGGVPCGCGERLRGALKYIPAREDGLVLYSNREAGGHLGHLLAPPARPDSGGPVIKVGHEREIASVLRDLGATSITLSSNTPIDVELLESLGITVVSYTGRAQAA